MWQVPRLDAMATKHTRFARRRGAGVVCTRQNVCILQVCRRLFGLDDKLFNWQPVSPLNKVFDENFTFLSSTSATVGLPAGRYLLFPCVPRHVVVLLFGPGFGHFSSLVQRAAPRRSGRCPCLLSGLHQAKMESTHNTDSRSNMIPPCCSIDVKSTHAHKHTGREREKKKKLLIFSPEALLGAKQKLASVTDSHYTDPL